MPRVTLYVTDELKARMDEVRETVNWSAVAQGAFREAVAIHAVKRNPTDMNEVIERLRASKARVEERSRESGKECGKTWAQQAAEYDELKRIAGYAKIKQVPAPVNLEAVQTLIDPEKEMTRYEWHDFWQKHGDGDGDPNDAFAEGFVEGATEIYDEIADQL
jgi:hypothetical protein